MGGTFDPIHHGHLVAASEVQSVFGLDEVVFVPTGRPWQKESEEISDPEHRYLMTVVATAANPVFTVSRADIDRPGATYTIDTLRDLHAEHPEPALLGCAREADRLAADGWDEARLQQLVAGVPLLRVPGRPPLVREVLALAMQLRVV